jgi:hypothetical protein
MRAQETIVGSIESGYGELEAQLGALEAVAAESGVGVERRSHRERGPYVRGPYSRRDALLHDGRGRWSRWKTREQRDRERDAELVRRAERDERLMERDGVVCAGRSGRAKPGTALPQRAQRAAARLARLPPSRVCPRCGVVVVASRRWVVPPGGGVATCLSCHRKRGG